MHGYPAYADWSAGPIDRHLVPFLAEITRWLAADTPVLFAEFGQSTAPRGQRPTGVQVQERDAASYTAGTLGALREHGCIGALLWCYADYSPHLYDQPPLDLAVHERTFGLWRADGTPKPAVAEILTRSGQRRATPIKSRPWLDVTVDEFEADRRYQLTRLYQRFVLRDVDLS
jgi:endo-1,4-beta-mannosidase